SFLAAAGLVLARYSGQTAPVIAALAVNPEMVDGIGPHEGISLLPLACESQLTASEFLRRTAERWSRPTWYTSSLAGTLAAKCENRGEVLAGVYFASDDPGTLEAAVADEYVACLVPPFPLTITCAPQKSGFTLTCSFDPSRFAAPVMTQFINSVLRVHRELRSNPGARLGAINLLGDAESKEVAALGRLSSELVAPNGRIDTLFSVRAAEHPEFTALSCGEDRLTYRELEEHSNRMAEGLR